MPVVADRRREGQPVVAVDRPAGLAALTECRGAVVCHAVAAGGRPVADSGRPVADSGRLAVDGGRPGMDWRPGIDDGRLVKDGWRPVMDGGRLVTDGGRPVTDGGRPVTDVGRFVMDGGRLVMDGGRPVEASGLPVVEDRNAFDGTAALTGPAESGFRAAPGAAGRPAGPLAAAGILEAGRAVGCIMT
ncbi:hypothetical protein [Flavitalea sp. BT771]|uniref:hypothetical protein n=1 Tax=Flavitalea sp. BT771 TaxID=3063329 RepID=UPI0026E1F19E|nr:hypothetical protein [Flavitalea sp. BT771]